MSQAPEANVLHGRPTELQSALIGPRTELPDYREPMLTAQPDGLFRSAGQAGLAVGPQPWETALPEAWAEEIEPGLT